MFLLKFYHIIVLRGYSRAMLAISKRFLTKLFQLLNQGCGVVFGQVTFSYVVGYQQKASKQVLK